MTAACNRSGSADILGPDGPFAGAMPGFRSRPGQRELSARIEAVLERGGVLVAESGTGTGKTLAYLVPVIGSGRRVVISTGTRHLQDQVFHRDLPLAAAVLGRDVHAALLKGRSNYVCLYRAEREVAQQILDGVLDEGGDELRQWLGSTVDGDLSTGPAALQDPSLRRRWTSTADDCLASRCPRIADCHVYGARRRAQDADVVIGNHHLFLSDLILRDEGYPSLLPQYDAVIFDEAHQLIETGPLMLGLTLSTGMLRSLGRDALEANRRERPAAPVQAAVAALSAATEQVTAAFEGRQRILEPWPESDRRGAAVARLDSGLADLVRVLDAASPAGVELEQCWRRAVTCHARLRSICREPDDGRIHWYEADAGAVALRAAPVDLGAALEGLASEAGSGMVFLSATIGVGDDFTFFCRSMGLGDAQTARWESPFDFARNALLYLPDGMPLPADDGFAAAMVEAVVPVIEAFAGRTFVLFTSHRMLAEVAGRLDGRTNCRLWVQGRGAKMELVERFRAEGGVLLGTASFWEGVDVPGPALSCVIVDKLPFAAPDEPLLAARLEALRRQGLDPFRAYQLPRAILALKQGFGRLIRSESDRGVLMICDPRLRSRAYGRSFLRALPPLPVSSDVEDVRAFAKADGQRR